MHAPNLWRCGFGRVTIAAVSGQNGFASLNCLGGNAESLVLWQVTMTNANNLIVKSILQNSVAGSSAVNLTPAMPNQQPPPGTITTGTTATLPTTTYQWGSSNSQNNMWQMPFPFCIIPPGWSFVAYCATVNQVCDFAFYVESCLQEVLVDRYGPYLSSVMPTQ